MTELKAYKVCTISREKFYGLAATSLWQIKIKAAEVLGFGAIASASVVLEDDGTIVEDEDYFLCLPENTKLMLLKEGQTWTPAMQGTPIGESIMEVDGVDGAESWRDTAERVRQDLANINFMSEADLQSLIDVPCSDLASALGFSQKKTRTLQDSIQTALDRREEERQSKELLQLYLKATEKEDDQDPRDESAKRDETDGVRVEAKGRLPLKTLEVLKDKTHPETRLSNEELQMVVNLKMELMEVLGWDREKTEVLVEDCKSELNKRVESFQAVQSLRAHAVNNTSEPHRQRKPPAKRNKK